LSGLVRRDSHVFTLLATPLATPRWPVGRLSRTSDKGGGRLRAALTAQFSAGADTANEWLSALLRESAAPESCAQGIAQRSRDGL